MKKQKKKGIIIISFTIFIVTMVLSSLVLLLCHNVTYTSKFTTEKWINTSDADKYHYVDDLLENYDLVGKTSQEIEALLGEKYIHTKDDLGFSEYVDTEKEDIDAFCYYRIEDHPLDGWRILLIKYKDNVVVEVKQGIEVAG